MDFYESTSYTDNFENIFTASFEYKNSSFYLTDCNLLYAQINNCDLNIVGKKVCDFSETFNTVFLKELFSLKSNEIFSFIIEKNYSLWNVSLQMVFPICKIKGKRIDNLNFKNKFDFFSHPYLKLQKKLSLFLKYDNFSFTLQNADKSFFDYTKLQKGDNINNLIRKNLLMINSTSLLKSCIEDNTEFSFVDRYTDNGKNINFFCRLTPVCYSDNCGIFASIYILDNNIFYELLKNSSFFENYFASSNTGVAFYSDISKDIVRWDSVFFKEAGNDFEKIKKSNALRFCASEKNITFDEIEISSSYENSTKYSFAFIPIPENELTMIVCAQKFKIEDALKKLPIKLTSREFDVVSMVFKGEKNSYIALKLGIAEGTVKKTLYNIYNKLGITSRIDLINLIYR